MDATRFTPPPRRRLGRLAGGLLCCFSLAGCSVLHHGSRWPTPPAAVPLRPGAVAGATPLERAELFYARAELLAAGGAAGQAIGEYHRAAKWAWHALPDSPDPPRAQQLYRSSLHGMLAIACRQGYFDPRCGLRLPTVDGRPRIVPVKYQGFPWQPDDFQQLAPVGDYASKSLDRRYQTPGVGAPLVVRRRSQPGQPLVNDEQAFAATVVLHPDEPFGDDATVCSDSRTPTDSSFVLAFYDPLRRSSCQAHGHSLPLARDITAPIAFRLSEAGSANLALSGFLQVGGAEESRLYMIEPYQPGKIPVVFVHGLLSDSLTWANMANELRAQPWVLDNFQLWAFQYPTGQSFLRSAAELRAQLAQARRLLDPQQADPALSQIVLVGHSMGGLVCKLQITGSGEHLWRAVANRPLDQIVTTPRTRSELRESFFFQASPLVSRTIFIATPHRGSATASRGVGRVGSALVKSPPDVQAAHQQLICDNPDVFSAEVRRRVPTSVDLLEPQSELLQAIGRLPVRPGVVLHSIIGDHRYMIGEGRGDGVVPVSSARISGVASELLVDAKHVRVQQDPESVAEVLRILRYAVN